MLKDVLAVYELEMDVNLQVVKRNCTVEARMANEKRGKRAERGEPECEKGIELEK